MTEPRLHQLDQPMSISNMRKPVHPGGILADLLERENKSAVARRLGISRQMLYNILREKRPLTAEMAIRFAELVGTEADALLRIQADFDAWHPPPPPWAPPGRASIIDRQTLNSLRV
jgi:antitoxin HigA-1